MNIPRRKNRQQFDFVDSAKVILRDGIRQKIERVSSGSLRLWLIIGFLLFSLLVFFLWPIVEQAELNTRLVAAEQTLAGYRAAVLAYYIEKGSIPMDIDSKAGVKEASRIQFPPPNPTQSPELGYCLAKKTFGERLIEGKYLEQITFPLGGRSGKFKKEEELLLLNEDSKPKILALPLIYLEERFHKKDLFVKSKSDKVALLMISGLNKKEAVGLQSAVETSDNSRIKQPSWGCFFSPSKYGETYTGWIYLQDL